MRHLNAINSLGRKSADRKAMMANLASSLILHKRISTTTAKARALRTYVEPLITRSKDDSTHSRRVVFSYLGNKNAVAELFREVAPKIASRPGGYTRILKTGSRIGDAAEMCIIELVDFNENMLAAGEGTKTRASRRRRGSRKKSAEVAPAAETAVTEAATETIVAEAPAEAAAATETTAEVAATEAETPAEETGAETEDSKE
ncbi:MAG TPA: 50S ribosomal protein L17 [Bacteroidales bacterium]|jgi:large subunit ribosomal protein L17|nr:50S ribosomal protein L17 [Bacteroidales bacterium]MDI9533117.1 50S ribosomal protein L17 [Bacteroidota bacterium]MBP7035700.1 50S ribosomal protein L17 [Bacteroidales bacterium]MBP8709439.1 50S ribosomal protein L17 [Bacteroidales bacterium]MZQ78634.1 50S ribosomal protein L17 [Bacteroidales bacterium]